jgi:hypothetical protein
MRGAGRVVFAGVLLLIAGVINILYGIGALGNARIFVGDTRYILNDLNALGWVLVVIGLIQLTGGFSLLAGHTYGRVIGITAGILGAIGALFSIGGRYPWWSRRLLPMHLRHPRHLRLRGGRRSHGRGLRPGRESHGTQRSVTQSVRS